MKKVLAFFVGLAILATACTSTDNNAGTKDTVAPADTTAQVAIVDSVVPTDAGDIVRDLKPGEPLKFTGLQRPMVVDFWATWCGPCMRFKPTFHALSGRYAGRIDFVAVDVDECQEIADANQIQAIPAIFLAKPDGTVIRHEGYMDEEEFVEFLSQAL